MEFKNRFRELRREKELSMSQVAAIFGKSESAIRMWETGRTKPDADTLLKLAEFFDCSVDYLVGLSIFKNKNEQAQGLTENELFNHAMNRLPTDIRKVVIKSLINYMCAIIEVGKYENPEFDKYLKLANESITILLDQYAYYLLSLVLAYRRKQSEMESDEDVIDRFHGMMSMQKRTEALHSNAMKLLGDRIKTLLNIPDENSDDDRELIQKLFLEEFNLDE